MSDGCMDTETYQRLHHLIETQDCESAFNFALNFPPLSDTVYWEKIPLILSEVFKQDLYKLYYFIHQAMDHGFQKDHILLKYIEKLLILDHNHGSVNARSVILKRLNYFIPKQEHQSLLRMNDIQFLQQLFLKITSIIPKSNVLTFLSKISNLYQLISPLNSMIVCFHLQLA